MSVDKLVGGKTVPGRLMTEETLSWTATRPPTWYTETDIVLPRKGAVRKLLRRSTMSSAERTADIPLRLIAVS